jgi:arylsulfatase A-like enzyme
MAQLDDAVGALLKELDELGEANNAIVVFSTDNGAETFTGPDGGMTPFKASKGPVYEGGFRVPAIIGYQLKRQPRSGAADRRAAHDLWVRPRIDRLPRPYRPACAIEWMHAHLPRECEPG